ncbi:MAG: tyrosine-type recombinase/integrase [Thermoanaerobacter sp.]|uniref:tyrosine-type recombinase/integrase n=1 Tax=Thermoanaerobacter sp. TaxID=1755 RepID=UPI001E50EDCE|nr:MULTISPECIES: tyrosine-type recombinase/integrase [unclassified Thermoanaerobacter]
MVYFFIHRWFYPFYYLFYTRKGTYIHPRAFNSKYYKLREKAGLEKDKNLHALRYTFAARLLEAGVQLKVVQKLFGHTQISTTADIYSHVLLEVKRDSVKN